MPNSSGLKKLYTILLIALLLVLGGGLLASWVQTNGGAVTIKDVRFIGTNGLQMSALLYVPPGVTNKKPAPGILAIHGYINTRETQDGFAIEFVRRGYVVLALDQTGHGFSDPPAFANGYGGPDGLKYLRSLDIVDPNNVALEGHSMGGWASVIAASVVPTGYKSIVLEGSSTGTSGAPTGTVTFPRNFGLVYSQFDEFSQLMWLQPTGRSVVSGPKLQAAFGSNGPVEVGKLYGSIADGTARKLYQPAVTHPADHISPEAIGDAIEWMQLTLQGGSTLPPSDQIWYWKELGTFIAFIGMVLAFFPVGALLLRANTFNGLEQTPPASKSARGIVWWVAAVLMIAIPILSFFWLQHTGNDWIKANALWPQNITIGIMTWAVGNGLIALVLFLIWHFMTARKAGATAQSYGLTWEGRGIDWRLVWKSLVVAIAVTAFAYLLLAFSDWAFKTDFRLWVLAVRLMTPLQFRIFLSFLLPFTFFFLVQGIVLHGQMRPRNTDGSELSMGREMLINVALLVGGFIILLLIQYIPLFGGSPLPINESLLTIVAFQFVPLLTVVALVSTYFYRKTGHIYTGAFINAIFITWVIVAGTATHFAI
jgi:pimeloyl-ACP methyl ester carboxylesterase